MTTDIAPSRLDPQKRDLIRTALGLDKPRQACRNHCTSEPDYDGHELILEMVRDGLMRKGIEISRGLHYYHVTDAGKAALIASAGQEFGGTPFK